MSGAGDDPAPPPPLWFFSEERKTGGKFGLVKDEGSTGQLSNLLPQELPPELLPTEYDLAQEFHSASLKPVLLR
jgi:hypothetical protein